MTPLLIVDHGRLSPAEQLLVVTAQGVANRRQARVWMRTGGIASLLEPKVARPGSENVGSWGLLEKLGPTIRGAVVCKLNTPSVNVATSLAGLLDAVALDESLLDEAARRNLKVLRDVRGQNEVAFWNEAKAQMAKGIGFEQVLDKPGHLRDLAVARRAFVFDANDRNFRTQVARELGPHPLLYGWGRDEFEWIADLAKGGATGVPADWSLNLSALRHFPARLRRPIAASVPKPKEPHRTIAFVMSDGDNIQWLGGNFALDRGFWASTHRGKFPMSWEMAPILARDAPLILDHLYRTATPNDDFIAGPGFPGYTFPHFHPNFPGVVRQHRDLLRQSGVRVVSILNANEGSLAQADPLLAEPSVDAVIYKDYAPYHRRKGEVRRVGKKLTVSYRFILWEGLTSIDQLIQQVEAMPTDPRQASSYALINVHAWSFRELGGPMEAVARVIQGLGKETRVVTASQLLREHPGP